MGNLLRLFFAQERLTLLAACVGAFLLRLKQHSQWGLMRSLRGLVNSCLAGGLPALILGVPFQMAVGGGRERSLSPKGTQGCNDRRSNGILRAEVAVLSLEKYLTQNSTFVSDTDFSLTVPGLQNGLLRVMWLCSGVAARYQAFNLPVWHLFGQLAAWVQTKLHHRAGVSN